MTSWWRERARREGPGVLVSLVLAGCVMKVAAAMAVMLATGGAGGGRGWIFGLLTCGFTATGLVIILRGPEDRRATSLGTFFVLVGCTYADPLLIVGAVRGLAARPALLCLAALQFSALQPYFFWRFVQDFPRRLGPYEPQRLTHVATKVSLGVGILLFAGNLLLFLLPAGSPWRSLLAALDRNVIGSLYWPLLVAFALPVLPYMIWKTRHASPDERRRARVLLLGIGVGIAPSVLLTLAELMSPRLRALDVTPTGRIIVGLLVYPSLIAIPVTTAYAIIVHRALEVHLIVRKAIQYALARSTLVLATATPFAALVALMYRNRHQSLVEVSAGRHGTILLALTAGGIAAVASRPRLLRGLDRRFFREQYDAHAILASLVERTHETTNPAHLAATIPVEIDRALHLEASSLLLLDRSVGALETPTRAVRPLVVESALARHIATQRELLDVDWSDRMSWIHALPESDRQWLLDANARLLVPIMTRGGALSAALALGEKRSNLPYSPEDRVLLRSVAQAVAPALENGRAPAHARPRRPEDNEAPAAECVECGKLDVADASRCTRCGAGLEASVLPPLLAGKYEPVERVGRGGMGVVYRARDLTLARDVALKTLPRTTPEGAARMRREARAMAAVSHVNLEAIHALESWRGTPILIVEFLRGGTLAERLRDGPLAITAALDMGVAMSGALMRLHRAGILHRDIKPSNIGFDDDGAPKLLDFGLAWMLDAASIHPAGSVAMGTMPRLDDSHSLGLTGAGDIVGTIPYLSPESLEGAPLTPAVDLWALSMVTYEAIAGRHPYGRGDAVSLMHRIASDSVPDLRDVDVSIPEPVASFLGGCLHRDASRRPASAHEWRRRAESLRSPR